MDWGAVEEAKGGVLGRGVVYLGQLGRWLWKQGEVKGGWPEGGDRRTGWEGGGAGRYQVSSCRKQAEVMDGWKCWNAGFRSHFSELTAAECALVQRRNRSGRLYGVCKQAKVVGWQEGEANW